jgi:ectoine hydroxylase-related dioxygenase (phytanoyl-CoA dioxygenase family)
MTGLRPWEIDGFAVKADVLSETGCDGLAAYLDSSAGPGARTLLREPWCRALARDLRASPMLVDLMSRDAVVVQCTLFDKSPAKNWLVSLHQDLSIPVKRRVDKAECSGWAEKEGCLYVQPPAAVLEQLMAVRVHIDECPSESGALRVVPGSHASGRLDSAAIKELRSERGEVVVPVTKGGALVMKPLLLHASSKATGTTPRRVLHFVFGPPELPMGLEWWNAV